MLVNSKIFPYNKHVNLDQLLQIPDQDRDFNWDEKFFKAFSTAQVELLSMDPTQGPDHWPYLLCDTNITEKSKSSLVESSQKLFRWLSDRGIGLVVNPNRTPYPDFVFSYGMIWFFRQTGFFMLPPKPIAKKNETAFSNEEIQWHTGEPTIEYFPDYARQIVRRFFSDQNLLSVKILMLSQDRKNYDLAFSLESIGNPPTTEHKQIAEALSWFFPTHYSLALVSEAGFPAFKDL